MDSAKRVGRSVRQTASDVITRRHRPDYQIILYMGLLMLLGLIIMYAIGPQRANVMNNAYGTDFYTSTYFFIKQGLSLVLALMVFVAMAVIPYELMKKYASKVLLVGFITCAVLAISGWIGLGIAQCTLGACRWFELGPLGSLQPAEILKFGLLVFGAGFLAMRIRQGLINDVNKTLIPFGVIAAIAMLFVIVIQKDLGTGISLVAIMASMLFVGGLNRRMGTIIIIGGVVLGMLLILGSGHRRERLFTFLQGDTVSSQQADDNDYHIKHAKIAIGSGGLTGVGIGNSVQATGYLPEAINDSVFAIMGETFGFIGLTVILLLFGALLMRLLRGADHSSDIWMKLVFAGVFGWLASHVILNVASMTGVAPLTGITLPLLSFGGTSMIFIAGALGLAFQLSRYTVHGSLNKEMRYENPGSRRGLGRPRHTGSSRTT